MDAAFEVAEDLCEQMGLTIPGPELFKIAGAIAATEAVKSGLELLIPSASTAMTFSTTGITLAFIQRKLREISKKIDVILDLGRKSAKDKLTEGLTSLEHENYSDAYEAFSKGADKATDGFHTAQDNEGRVTCTKIKLFCLLMMKCYDKSEECFLPFAKLSVNRKKEVGALMKTTVDNLLDEMKHGKSGVDMMDILMFKAGVKRKMLQVRLNELFASSYRFMSEGLQWTTPNEVLNEEAEIVSIQVYPDYLPVGQDDAIELVFGKGQNTKTPLSVTMHRIILDKSKKQSKIVVQKTDFIVDEDFDQHLMIEIFSGKIAAFRDLSTLLIDAARIGRSDLMTSTLENHPDLDINAKNFKGQCALHMAAASDLNNLEALKTLMAFGKSSKTLDWNITDDKGNTALHYAAKNGNLPASQLLAPKMKSVDPLNAKGDSPLSIAAANGFKDLAHFLLSQKAKVNHRNTQGLTPIFQASMNSHLEVVKLLLKYKADPMVPRQDDQATSLWVASSLGHLEVVKALAKVLKKSQMKQPNMNGITPAVISRDNEHIMTHFFLKKQGAI